MPRGRSISFRIKTTVASLSLLLVVLITSTAFYGEYRAARQEELLRIQVLREVSRELSEKGLRTLLTRSFPYWDLHPSGEPREMRSPPAPVLLPFSGGSSLTVRFNDSRLLGDILFQQRHVLVMAVIGLVLAMEAAIFTAYTLARPLHRLAEACRNIARRRWQVLPLQSRNPEEIQLLQQAFNTMVEELQHWEQVQHQVFRVERLAALGQMVAGVSHEIRNPLASMRVHLDLLREALSPEEHLSVRVLDTELDRLNTIVSQLLSFARPGEHIRGPVKVEELFRWCRDIALVRLRKKGLSLRESLPPGKHLRVLGSMPQLQQLLLNLLLNAIAASPQGGILELEAREEERGILLSVTDSGGGIPPEIRDRIFDPFVSGGKEGTGLGLSIAARIADLHGGTLGFRTSGESTTFFVQLRSCEEEEI